MTFCATVSHDTPDLTPEEMFPRNAFQRGGPWPRHSVRRHGTETVHNKAAAELCSARARQPESQEPPIWNGPLPVTKHPIYPAEEHISFLCNHNEIERPCRCLLCFKALSCT